MRKFIYSMSLFFICIFIFYGFYYSYHNEGDSLDTQEHTIETEHMILPEFHIRIHQNKVIVYLPDGNVYETTDILWDELPMDIQKKIETGLVLYSKQELYNFLESYSS